MASELIHGSGPTRLLFLHGWLGTGRSFAPLLQGLDPEIFTCAFLDYRGYGAEIGMGGPFDLATIAADALAFADRLGWFNFSLVGHSMGGKAALLTAITAPERVERICGITPVWAGAAPFDPATFEFFDSAADSVEARQAIVDNTTGNRLPKFWSRRVAQRSSESSTTKAFGDYFRSWALEDFAEQAGQLHQETLVLVGGHDVGVPEEGVRRTWLTHLRNARLVVLPEAGHYPMDECPLILASALADFLG